METYDYVIVGAGSAGCALANRLSEDPTIKVCLIEAGKKDNALMVRMPAGVGNLIKAEGAYNWGFWTEPQKHMNGRKLWWPRGKGWGGSEPKGPGLAHLVDGGLLLGLEALKVQRGSGQCYKNWLSLLATYSLHTCPCIP